MNGDGAVNMADFTLYRPKIGTKLPAVPATPSVSSMTADLVDRVLGTIDPQDFAGPSSTTIATGAIARRNPLQKRSTSPSGLNG